MRDPEGDVKYPLPNTRLSAKSENSVVGVWFKMPREQALREWEAFGQQKLHVRSM
jgi:hypothetical protein